MDLPNWSTCIFFSPKIMIMICKITSFYRTVHFNSFGASMYLSAMQVCRPLRYRFLPLASFCIALFSLGELVLLPDVLFKKLIEL